MALNNQSNITNFLLDIPASAGIKVALMNVQQASIPGFRIPPTELPLGEQGTARQNIPSTTTEFDPLIVRILLDEDYDAYFEIYRWMLSINDYARQTPTMWGTTSQPPGVTLHVLSNSKHDIVASFNYQGAWPSEIGEIEYSYTEEGDVSAYFTVTFFFKYFEIERKGQLVRPIRG
ncbi:gp3 [Aeromonas phage 31]|uniref:Tail completion and sheath stabilizer protein n=4 Tax=Biquartavirus TaxID=1912143 RepID=Q6U9G8_9CAUD|nr:gp3 [Aeromonas phage 44RR2.8t]YP_238861.1 tail completion and sheath stabilizer protein [Aeromonas phage 31]APU00606.1 tail completion protein [Aeromonas phage 44RR2.8t.2]APU01027.1 tail completion protein [Aeromonas phage 31.2]APU01936.1 tail completion protein [Aeromonas phage L9-6]APU02188.1 tail completion protein [Aeromonas phage Riv-10]APU02434.1 tail completion protein [Aeromonas phage SW69-9]UYD59688.1 tail tube terminator protein [Aeromonas phage avDM5]UYD60582.1 tail tube termi